MIGSLLKDREQHTRRFGMKKKDRWGREWHCQVDRNAVRNRDNEPSFAHVGIPTLGGRYKPVVDIPPKYLKKQDPEEPTMMNVDLDLWERDLRAAAVHWQDAMRDWAKKMYPNTFGEALANPPAELLQVSGPMPLPVEFVHAMKAGNKWVLGIPKPDGSYYPRPKWATDELMERYHALMQSYWSPGTENGELPRVDLSKYADEEGDEDAVTVAVGVDEDSEDYSDEDLEEAIARPVRSQSRRKR